MNSLTIIGTSGHDSRVNVTKAGLTILSFSIAYSESKKDASGQWINSPPQWWNCKVFGKYAESLSIGGRAPKKGERVIVQGAVQLRDYTDKTGASRTSHDILVQTLVVIPKRVTEAQAEPPAELPPPVDPAPPMFTEDDIPF